jgi:pimeloyl-ACP methyl ester carboxylesterase
VLAQAEPTFALAGFSMGGYVAQEIARIAPERIARLALIDTAIRADTPERAAQRRAVNAAAGHEGAFLGVADRLMASYVDASRLDDKDLTGRIQAMTQRLGREVFLRQNGLPARTGRPPCGPCAARSSSSAASTTPSPRWPASTRWPTPSAARTW